MYSMKKCVKYVYIIHNVITGDQNFILIVLEFITSKNSVLK